MAQKGRGKKIRFQGGTVFPVAVLAVAVIGVALILYARGSIDSEAPGPRASNGDHWHVAYGFYACDAESAESAYLGNLTGNIESTSKYLATGVHSHDDGVIHWHPTSAKASGRNAKLDVFLDNYDIDLTDDKLTFPVGQLGGAVYEEGVTKCMDEDGNEVDGELKAFVWPQSSNPNDFRVLAANLGDVRITDNGMAITIAFVPADVNSIPEPDTAARLPELGAVDGGTPIPTDTVVDGTDTTVAGTDDTEAVVSSTTVAGATTTAGATATTEG